MKLEQHICDTLKEWELKMGKIDSEIRLYYPPDSISDFLGIGQPEEGELLKEISAYLKKAAPYLGDVEVSAAKDHRIGIAIPKEGCEYVETQIDIPEFLKGMLEVYQHQNLDEIRAYFADYAKSHGCTVIEEKESDGLGTVLYFDCEQVEPYVYCFDSDVFGVTYHRFSVRDYEKLK